MRGAWQCIPRGRGRPRPAEGSVPDHARCERWGVEGERAAWRQGAGCASARAVRRARRSTKGRGTTSSSRFVRRALADRRFSPASVRASGTRVTAASGENTGLRARARVIAELPAGPLASSPQLHRLHTLGLLRDALADDAYVTRSRAWEMLKDAAEKGLWTMTVDPSRPAGRRTLGDVGDAASFPGPYAPCTRGS